LSCLLELDVFRSRGKIDDVATIGLDVLMIDLLANTEK